MPFLCDTVSNERDLLAPVLAPAMAVASSLDQVFSEYAAALDLMTGHCME